MEKYAVISDMYFKFEALDEHSSLKEVQWKVYAVPGDEKLGQGALPVVEVNDTVSCKLYS